MADLTTLQTRLDQAETALHKLMTGSLVEHIQADARTGAAVRYTPAQVPALQRYIASLKNQIAVASGGSVRRRAFVVNL